MPVVGKLRASGSALGRDRRVLENKKMNAKLMMHDCPTPMREVMIESVDEWNTRWNSELVFKVLDLQTGIRVCAHASELWLEGVSCNA